MHNAVAVWVRMTRTGVCAFLTSHLTSLTHVAIVVWASMAWQVLVGVTFLVRTLLLLLLLLLLTCAIAYSHVHTLDWCTFHLELYNCRALT